MLWPMLAAPAWAANLPKYGSFGTPLFSTTIVPPSHLGEAQVLAGLPADADVSAAPVPDTEQYAPVLRQLGPRQPEFAPSLFRPRTAFHGEGYVPGSTVQGSQERRLSPAAGVNVSVPLD